MKFSLTTSVIVAASAIFVGALAAPSVHLTGSGKPQPVGVKTTASNEVRVVDAPTPPPAKPSPKKSLTFAPGQPDAPGKATAALKVVESRYGPIVVSADGYAVYMSDSDDQNPPKSVCYTACTKKWIPLLTSGEVTLDDAIPSGAVGTLKRWDGGTQLTLRGWPLYLFVNDKQPGDITGHNKALHWQVLAPDGTPVP
jgi:predicted lipoprotein with Yx(FWY)xxD motif